MFEYLVKWEKWPISTLGALHILPFHLTEKQRFMVGWFDVEPVPKIFIASFLSVVSAQMKTKVSLNTSVFLTRNKKLLFNVQRELNAAKVAKH